MALYEALVTWESPGGTGPGEPDAVLRLVLPDGDTEGLDPSEVRSAARAAVMASTGESGQVLGVRLLRRLDVPPVASWDFRDGAMIWSRQAPREGQ